jgi:hypothetical protein
MGETPADDWVHRNNEEHAEALLRQLFCQTILAAKPGKASVTAAL